VAEADVILTMREEHKAETLARFPDARGKVFVIGEYLDDPGHEVPDPFGLSLDNYRKAAARLEYFAHLFFEKHRDR
jgi:protein-tyrosine phosphatase